MNFKFGMLSKTRIFGIAIVLYALVSTGLICWDMENYTFNVNTNTIVIIGGLVMLVSGLVISIKEDFDKMVAIGLYSMSFAVFKICRAFSAMTIDPKNLDLTKIQMVDVISVIIIISSIMLFMLGLSFLLGTAKKIGSKVIMSLVFIVLNGFTFMSALAHGDSLLMATMVIETVILIMFIFLLLSKDVRINTVSGKRKYASRISSNELKTAKQDYKLALAEAKALRKSGNKEAAASVERDAKEDYDRKLNEIEQLKRKAEKKRYRYNPETKKVEVVGEKDDDSKL